MDFAYIWEFIPKPNYIYPNLILTAVKEDYKGHAIKYLSLKISTIRNPCTYKSRYHRYFFYTFKSGTGIRLHLKSQEMSFDLEVIGHITNDIARNTQCW